MANPPLTSLTSWSLLVFSKLKAARHHPAPQTLELPRSSFGRSSTEVAALTGSRHKARAKDRFSPVVAHSNQAILKRKGGQGDRHKE